MSGATLGVLVVADATSTRRRIRAALDASPDFEVAGEADDLDGAIACTRERSPDVVVLDLPLPPAGLAAAEALLRSIRPGLRTVTIDAAPVSAEAFLVDLTDALGSRTAAPASPRAVVCDDDTMTRQIVGRVLAAEGVDVVADIDVVPNLLPVVEIAHPEVVILDLWLEGTTGLSALPELLAVDDPPAVVVYSSRDEWREPALAGGAFDFVSKPDVVALGDAVRRALLPR